MTGEIKISPNQPSLFTIREDGTLKLPFSKKSEQLNIDPDKASLIGIIKHPPVITGKDRAAGEREGEDD